VEEVEEMEEMEEVVEMITMFKVVVKLFLLVKFKLNNLHQCGIFKLIIEAEAVMMNECSINELEGGTLILLKMLSIYMIITIY